MFAVLWTRVVRTEKRIEIKFQNLFKRLNLLRYILVRPEKFDFFPNE
jgi:hypothetical protein